MSGTHERESPQSEDARTQAEEWFVRIRSDSFTAEEFAAWESWLARDEAHRSAFELVERLWAKIGQVHAVPWPSAQEIEADEYEGDVPVAQWISACSQSPRATTLAREYQVREPDGAGPGNRDYRDRATDLDAADLDAADLTGAGPGNRDYRDRHAAGRGWPWTGLIAAGVAACALTLWWRAEFLDPAATITGEYRTGLREHQTVELPDGSEVIVGARSELSVRFSEHARELHLQSGAAYFRVAKDEARPFVVEAGLGRITAIGTEFDVRQLGQQVVTLTVVEGVVDVRSDGDEGYGAKRVRAGETLEYGDTLGAVRPVQINTADLWWRARYFKYADQPLEQVLPDVQRYSDQRLVIADRAAGRLSFSGTVWHDGVPDWLDGLEDAMPVEVESADGRTVVIRSRSP